MLAMGNTTLFMTASSNSSVLAMGNSSLSLFVTSTPTTLLIRIIFTAATMAFSTAATCYSRSLLPSYSAMLAVGNTTLFMTAASNSTVLAMGNPSLSFLISSASTTLLIRIVVTAAAMAFSTASTCYSRSLLPRNSAVLAVGNSPLFMTATSNSAMLAMSNPSLSFLISSASTTLLIRIIVTAAAMAFSAASTSHSSRLLASNSTMLTVDNPALF